MTVDPSRDKDYSFARLCDLKSHVTIKMYDIPYIITLGADTFHSASLEGNIEKYSYTDILNHPELRHTGIQAEYVILWSKTCC